MLMDVLWHCDIYISSYQFEKTLTFLTTFMSSSEEDWFLRSRGAIYVA